MASKRTTIRAAAIGSIGSLALTGTLLVTHTPGASAHAVALPTYDASGYALAWGEEAFEAQQAQALQRFLAAKVAAEEAELAAAKAALAAAQAAPPATVAPAATRAAAAAVDHQCDGDHTGFSAASTRSWYWTRDGDHRRR